MSKEDALFIARSYAVENNVPVIYECHGEYRGAQAVAFGMRRAEGLSRDTPEIASLGSAAHIPVRRRSRERPSARLMPTRLSSAGAGYLILARSSAALRFPAASG